ncbi:MAG: branched-chain amino acid aminotransferase [Alphaproteobacteria bacterium]|nr:branched-chain amino acid aminotransferase [Alphaproteobacteria bacterium]
MQQGGRSVAYFEGAWIDGKTPIMTANTHGAWLGSMVFDGGRIYRRLGPDLDRHCARAVASARTIGLAPQVDGPTIERLAWQGADKFADDAELYVRPMFWAEDGPLGPDPATTRFALYLEEAKLTAGNGFTACLARRRRPSPETMPTEAKASGLYAQVGLIALEARQRGFDASVVLDLNGNVAEFTAANLFIVKDGVVSTPVANRTFLNGITRQRAIQLLRGAGREVQERTITFDEVLAADEIFSSGNYAKIRPCVKIEDRVLDYGPVTKQTWSLYQAFAEKSRRPRG